MAMVAPQIERMAWPDGPPRRGKNDASKGTPDVAGTKAESWKAKVTAYWCSDKGKAARHQASQDLLGLLTKKWVDAVKIRAAWATKLLPSYIDCTRPLNRPLEKHLRALFEIARRELSSNRRIEVKYEPTFPGQTRRYLHCRLAERPPAK
jgi:hypothetical protein